MVTTATFRTLALSFPEAEEAPHFENTAFKVRKKIFVTLAEKHGRITVKLSATDQSAFCSYDPAIIYPVPNKWGKQGWTHIVLAKIDEEMLLDALTTAYCTIAPKTLAKPYIDARDAL